MKFQFRIIFYFGFAGVLVSVFLTVVRLIEDNFEQSFLTICGNFFTNAVLAYIITVIVSSVVMYSLVRINTLLPWKKNAWVRFGADVILTPLIAMLVMAPLAVLTYRLGLEYAMPTLRGHVIHEMVIALVVDLILVGIYEGYYFFHLWKQSLIQNEKLEKENLTAKYEALKNQVNPHFLFNSLNTVSALIHEDPDKAEAFIDEFSKIYRCLLEQQDKNFQPLRDELNFVSSYLSLQKIRFGESLHATIDVSTDRLSYFIPTFSLQLLVENAIKHNLVTRDYPLTICIGIEGEHVVVSNTLQLRKESLASTGIGLNNLDARYRLLADQKPVFMKTDMEYIAKLPLIKEVG